MSEPTPQEVMEATNVTHLSPWFEQQLRGAISRYEFRDVATISKHRDRIVEELGRHRQTSGRNRVVIGISGGLDSALVAALFKAAGWHVDGLLLPIHQNAAETERGHELCSALRINPREIDLSDEYDYLASWLENPKANGVSEAPEMRLRMGNIRARMRMIALYDRAQAVGGVVASTDNLSEFTAGFWTLHGDVGDIAPIQALNKSWDVPVMAAMMQVPQAIIRAVPTDGLGISGSDEDQLGCRYLEWDIVMYRLLLEQMRNASAPEDVDEMISKIVQHADEEDVAKVGRIVTRMRSTAHKHKNPHNYDHKIIGPYPGVLEAVARLAATLNPSYGVGTG